MNKTNETKLPTHAVWQVTRKDDKARWSRIGSAWPNKDGKGFNLILGSVPLTGHISVREITAKAGAGGQQ